MVEATTLTVLLVAGFTIGLLYYGGLWWTVRSLPRVERPALVVGLSFVVRLALAGGLMVWIMDGRPMRLLIVLGGFFAGRLVLTRWLGPARSERREETA